MKALSEIETSFYRAGAAADPPAQQHTEATMNAKQNVKSEIEQQLNTIHMSERMRSAALNDARKAEAFVELFTWVGSKFNRPYADAFAKPSPKY